MRKDEETRKESNRISEISSCNNREEFKALITTPIVQRTPKRTIKHPLPRVSNNAPNSFHPGFLPHPKTIKEDRSFVQISDIKAQINRPLSSSSPHWS